MIAMQAKKVLPPSVHISTFTKETAIGLITAVTGFFAFWLWREVMPLFQSGVLTNAGSFAAPIIVLMLAASFFFMSATLISRASLRYAASALTVILPFFLALPPKHILVLIPISALLAMFASRRMHHEYDLSLGFSTLKIAKAGLPLFFTVASILAAWFYFQTIEQQDRQKAAATLVPRPVTDLVIRILAEPLKEATGLPEIRADLTVDELFVMGIRRELQKTGVTLNRASEQGVSELLAHQRDTFAKQYGVTLSGSERVGDVMHRAIIERLESILGPFVQFLPVISALAFFFAFKAFTFPVYLLSVALTACLIRLFSMATIIKSERRQIEVERLTL